MARNGSQKSTGVNNGVNNPGVLARALPDRLDAAARGDLDAALLKRVLSHQLFCLRMLIASSITPESGHVRCNYGCPLWAKSGHCRVAKCPKNQPGQCHKRSTYLV
jgi:hypothetical protein